MKVKELRNDQGLISGLVISADDIRELKTNLKPNTQFFEYVDNLQADIDHTKRVGNEIMPTGLSLAQTNELSAKVTLELYRNSFKNKVPVYYKDERSTPKDEFVRANPDGSEDLVKYHLQERNYTVLKRLTGTGKGAIYQIINLK